MPAYRFKTLKNMLAVRVGTGKDNIRNDASFSAIGEGRGHDDKVAGLLQNCGDCTLLIPELPRSQDQL